MPSTVDYWDADGYSLNEYVRNLDSWGGSREEPAELRGSNLKIPYAYGEKFLPKLPGRRRMGLTGWISGERAGVENEANLKQNWRELRALLWRPEEEFTLTRRWRDENDVLKTASGLAQYVSGLAPEISNTVARFAVELEMADPFFYGPEISMPLATTYTFIVDHGDYPTKKMFLDLVGPLTTPKVNFVSGSGSGMFTESTTSYPTIAAGTTVTIDIEKFKATETTAGVTTKTSVKVTNTISPAWAKMGRDISGINPRVLYSGAGTGTVTLRYKPAYH